MKSAVLISIFVFSSIFEGGLGADPVGYFYKEMGCTKNDGKVINYNCPDFTQNTTCYFKNEILKPGERLDRELLKGSCNADCSCSLDGQLTCARYDCWFQIKPGCSLYKYSLDSCCPVGSVCDTPAECVVDGKTHKEGQHIYPKDTCDICVCDKDFKQEAPFCRPRKCMDQANNQYEVKRNGAPVFFKNENCCPNTWTMDEGEKIIKLNPEAPTDSKLFCKFGDRKVQLGHGFEKSVKPYGEVVPLRCECTAPPFVICREK
ncbi:hypothetical protein WA026_011491 [Henosepilachna vigintioctopunctata]|uniref:VWFC domain-containing protein n=1 Tax=Henosepilachna vigintioctopunctata TaxID=420089 RepID=A0AAW1TVM5_9CUCU